MRTAERVDPARFRISVFYRQPGPLLDRYRSAGISTYHVPIPNLYGPTSVRRGIEFARMLSSHSISILHAHDVYSNIFGTFYSRFARTPVTIVSRRWWHYVPRASLNRLNRWAARRATCVLANSNAIKAMMAGEEGIDPDRIEVIPNFLDDGAFDPLDQAERKGELARLGVPPRSFVVGCVANLNAVKNHRLLLRAAARLAPAHPDVHYVLFGEGPLRDELEGFAAELGLADRVHLPGQRIEPWNLHGLFDVSVLCSTSEGFPNTIVEAMAAGRAVVATDVGGNADAVEHGETGLLVASDDSEALAAALGSLIVDPSRRASMGDRGREVARERFHVDHVVPRLEGLYRRLLDRGQ